MKLLGLIEEELDLKIVDVKEVTEEVVNMCHDLGFTMNHHKLNSISAPAVGSNLKILVLSCGTYGFGPSANTCCMINPIVLETSYEVRDIEGTPRHQYIKMEWTNIFGGQIQTTFVGLPSYCIQEELDKLQVEL